MSVSSYSLAGWNRYARAHASVMTSYQWEMFRECAAQLSGHVIDCGCGTARIAPLLSDREQVLSYTGVDMSPDMVDMARWMVSWAERDDFRIQQGLIEKVEGRFNSAVSIHSYYTWPDPLKVLTHIHAMLYQKSRFVLVTPNAELDMEHLLQESARELIAHPDFDHFRRLNMELANNPGAAFVSMDTLVEQSRKVGFAVVECHQRHFLGGVNFLVLEKR